MFIFKCLEFWCLVAIVTLQFFYLQLFEILKNCIKYDIINIITHKKLRCFNQSAWKVGMALDKYLP